MILLIQDSAEVGLRGQESSFHAGSSHREGVDVDSIADNALHFAIFYEIGAVGALITTRPIPVRDLAFERGSEKIGPGRL